MHSRPPKWHGAAAGVTGGAERATKEKKKERKKKKKPDDDRASRRAGGGVKPWWDGAQGVAAGPLTGRPRMHGLCSTTETRPRGLCAAIRIGV